MSRAKCQNCDGQPDSWAWASLSSGDIVAGGRRQPRVEPSYWSDDQLDFDLPTIDGYSAKMVKRGQKSISRIGLARATAYELKVHFRQRAIFSVARMPDLTRPIGCVVPLSAASLAKYVTGRSCVCLSWNFAWHLQPSMSITYLLASRRVAKRANLATTFIEKDQVLEFLAGTLPV